MFEVNQYQAELFDFEENERQSARSPSLHLSPWQEIPASKQLKRTRQKKCVHACARSEQSSLWVFYF